MSHIEIDKSIIIGVKLHTVIILSLARLEYYIRGKTSTLCLPYIYTSIAMSCIDTFHCIAICQPTLISLCVGLPPEVMCIAALKSDTCQSFITQHMHVT